MELFCAVDVRGGEAVRLVEGDFARQSGYGDPLALGRRYVEAGARWLHVVDLDAARTGKPVNRDVVLALAGLGAKVQAGGGVRDADAAAALLRGGVDRVVLGTVAVERPGLMAELAAAYPGRIVVGLDHRGGGAELAVDGWARGGGRSVADVLGELGRLPLAAVVVTAIERDGTMTGPDTAGLRRFLVESPLPVVASGGVRSAGDVALLAGLEGDGRRLAGVVVGKALADGALGVEEAIAACAPCG